MTAVDIPGGHSSMLQEPNARLLAEAMNLHIEHAIERYSPPQPVHASTPVHEPPAERVLQPAAEVD